MKHLRVSKENSTGCSLNGCSLFCFKWVVFCFVSSVKSPSSCLSKIKSRMRLRLVLRSLSQPVEVELALDVSDIRPRFEVLSRMCSLDYVQVICFGVMYAIPMDILLRI